MDKMDALLRMQVVAEVKKAMNEALEGSREIWLSGDELGKRFGFFTRSWLKTYGSLLPRERVSVDHGGNEVHRTGWCYPLHRIERLVNEGKLRRLVVLQGKGSSRKLEECFPTINELTKI